MDGAGVAAASSGCGRVMRSYLTWRRTTFLASLPILLFSSVWEIVALALSDMGKFTGFGKLLFILPAVSPAILMVFSALALFRWSCWRRSTALLRVGWGASFVLPFVPGLFPLDSIVTTEYRSSQDTVTFRAEKVVFALMYAIQLLPVVVTFPGGSVRAALRIRGLLPESSLTSWVLVVSAPFYSLIMLIALILVLQLAGNWLIIVGSIVLATTPWTYVVFRRLLVSASTPEKERRIDFLQRCTGLVNLAGWVLLFLWFLTAFSAYAEFISTGDLIRAGIVGWSRMILTTVLLCDVYLRMTVTNWKHDTERRRAAAEGEDPEQHGNRVDELFDSIQGLIGKESAKESSAKTAVGDSLLHNDGAKKGDRSDPEKRNNEVDLESGFGGHFPDVDDTEEPSTSAGRDHPEPEMATTAALHCTHSDDVDDIPPLPPPLPPPAPNTGDVGNEDDDKSPRSSASNSTGEGSGGRVSGGGSVTDSPSPPSGNNCAADTGPTTEQPAADNPDEGAGAGADTGSDDDDDNNSDDDAGADETKMPELAAAAAPEGDAASKM